jgi:hypothetical protein
METPVRSHHHLTLCVGGAQEDYDFHVKTLGLRSVKKTSCTTGKSPSIIFTTATAWAMRAR